MVIGIGVVLAINLSGGNPTPRPQADDPPNAAVATPTDGENRGDGDNSPSPPTNSSFDPDASANTNGASGEDTAPLPLPDRNPEIYGLIRDWERRFQAVYEAYEAFLRERVGSSEEELAAKAELALDRFVEACDLLVEGNQPPLDTVLNADHLGDLHEVVIDYADKAMAPYVEALEETIAEHVHQFDFEAARQAVTEAGNSRGPLAIPVTLVERQEAGVEPVLQRLRRSIDSDEAAFRARPEAWHRALRDFQDLLTDLTAFRADPSPSDWDAIESYRRRYVDAVAAHGEILARAQNRWDPHRSFETPVLEASRKCIAQVTDAMRDHLNWLLESNDAGDPETLARFSQRSRWFMGHTTEHHINRRLLLEALKPFLNAYYERSPFLGFDTQLDAAAGVPNAEAIQAAAGLATVDTLTTLTGGEEVMWRDLQTRHFRVLTNRLVQEHRRVSRTPREAEWWARAWLFLAAVDHPAVEPLETLIAGITPRTADMILQTLQLAGQLTDGCQWGSTDHLVTWRLQHQALQLAYAYIRDQRLGPDNPVQQTFSSLVNIHASQLESVHTMRAMISYRQDATGWGECCRMLLDLLQGLYTSTNLDERLRSQQEVWELLASQLPPRR